MEPIICINADQVSVESGVMDFRQRDAVRHHWLAKPVVLIGNNVGGVQKQRLRQSRQCASAIIGSDDGLTERRLVQSLLDRAQGITPLERVLRWFYRLLIRYTERDARLQLLG